MRHAKKRRPFPWASVVLVSFGIALLTIGALTYENHKKTDPSVSLSPQVMLNLPAPVSSRPDGCDAWPEVGRAPQQIGIDGLGFREIESLPRVHNADDSVSSPDPTNHNPTVFAWDNESSKPGEPEGKVLLTAHTYRADNSALGNRLIAQLKVGNLVRVRTGQLTLCYQVRERLQVAVQKYPVERVYESNSEGIAITVCTGYDSGKWKQRIVWFAIPVK